MAIVAIDLGGTKLAGAILTRTGRVLQRRTTQLAGRQGRAVGDLICDEVGALLALARAKKLVVHGIGVCVPGISRAATHKVWAPNIPGWDNYPLRAQILDSLAPRSRVPVMIDSDRACYILGEHWQGAARGCRDAIFLAVGTGIGAGILSGGQVLRGAHDSAGAIGWLALDRPFRSAYVSCGCFEHHASGVGLAKVARELAALRGRSSLATGLTARDLFDAFERREPLARAVVRQAIEFWGMAVANLVSLFNPRKIIFGGGVFGPARRHLKSIYAEARKWAQPIAIRQVKLEASRLGQDAGLYGAGWLALRANRNAD